MNAGGSHPSASSPGGCFFDSATSFGIIRGGHVDYTVLGVLEGGPDGQPGQLQGAGQDGSRPWAAPWTSCPGARVVIASTLHFEPSGASRMKRHCTLPLTAAREVNFVVTDLGLFEVVGDRFHLREVFAPYTAEFIKEKTDADIVIDTDCRVVEL